MKTNSSNGLSYTGVVHIDFLKNDATFHIKLHNQGTISLGTFFSKALAGSFSKDDCPQWLNFESEDSPGRWQSLLRVAVPFTGTTYVPQEMSDANDTPATIGEVKFVATLQSNNVRSTSVENKLLRLSMWNNRTPQNALAYIEDETISGDINKNLILTYNALSSGQDAVVNWLMYITNKTKEVSK